MSRDGSVGTGTGYGLAIGWLGFDSQRGLWIFFFDTMTRPPVGTIHPPI